MPDFTGPTGTTQPYIAALNRNQKNRVPGTVKTFPTLNDLNAAVVQERTNVNMNLPVWFNRETLTVDDEPTGVERRWSASAAHARLVVIGTFSAILDADSNRVRATSGVPSNGTGSNGDLALDAGAGAVYERESGAWQLLATLGGGTTEPAPKAVSGSTYTVLSSDRTLDFTGSGACVVTVPSSLPSSLQVAYLVTGSATVTFVDGAGEALPNTASVNTAAAGTVGAIMGTSTAGVFWLLNGEP